MMMMMMKIAALQFILAILQVSLNANMLNSAKSESDGAKAYSDDTNFVSQTLQTLDGVYFEMIGLRFEGVGRIIEAERALMTAKRLNRSRSISKHVDRIKCMQCRNFTSSDLGQARVIALIEH